MTSSSIYHTYNPLSHYYYYFWLKIDLIGIGIMIFGMTITAVFVGFHNWIAERDFITAVMASLMIGNLCIQMTPCYAEERFNCHRIVFYFSTLMICLALAISGRFYYATDIEVEEFYGALERSFIYLGIGFVFYLTKFPESRFPGNEFIQLYLNSHMWWHIFTFANGYTLFWLCYSFNLHVEEYLDKNEPGSPAYFQELLVASK